MPWVRIDDSFHDHPKLDALGALRLPCVGLNILALAWSSHWLTDGFIPADRVRRLGGSVHLANALVRAGLWEEAGEDYRIHDFLAYNPSRQDVLAEREHAKERMRNRRRSSGEVQPNTERSSGYVQPPRPVPSLPVHSIPVPLERAGSKNPPKRDPEVQRMLDLQEKALAERAQENH